MYKVIRYLNNDNSTRTRDFSTYEEAKKEFNEIANIRGEDFKKYGIRKGRDHISCMFGYLKILDFNNN